MIVLKFNNAATKMLEGNTRLRLNVKKRGGIEFIALRPSYRVSGKNVQARVEQVEGEDFHRAEITDEQIAAVPNLPEFKNNINYFLENIGYGWLILKPAEAEVDFTGRRAIVAASKSRKGASKKVAPEAGDAGDASVESTEQPKATEQPQATEQQTDTNSTAPTETAETTEISTPAAEEATPAKSGPIIEDDSTSANASNSTILQTTAESTENTGNGSANPEINPATGKPYSMSKSAMAKRAKRAAAKLAQ